MGEIATEVFPQFTVTFNHEAAAQVYNYAVGRPLDLVLANLIDDSFAGRLDLGRDPNGAATVVQNVHGVQKTVAMIGGSAGVKAETIKLMVFDLHLNATAQKRLVQFRPLPGISDASILQTRLEEWLSRTLWSWTDTGAEVLKVEPIAPQPK